MSEVAQSTIPRLGKTARSRMPTRLGRRQELAGGDLSLREAEERNERDRWLKELQKVLVDARLPVSVNLGRGDVSEIRFAKGRAPGHPAACRWQNTLRLDWRSHAQDPLPLHSLRL